MVMDSNHRVLEDPGLQSGAFSRSANHAGKPFRLKTVCLQSKWAFCARSVYCASENAHDPSECQRRERRRHPKSFAYFVRIFKERSRKPLGRTRDIGVADVS